ncbi:orotidine-5'-phosphate decarboxylase [Phreatobacter sp.]|uniref:orotidine-5'-phosphate decarboxylase n=1 Tax=Phreatobacter sp. TaxID=1966341 RepID=UPI0022BD4728|nr:orotidine-5'-phosphate decarboxylase [Phreatobacter sp.]MCZ8313653.1 orotidine-5'-phosphate decarboxylase [Phreatobacter sp.]
MTLRNLDPRQRLFVALDLSSLGEAERLVDRLGDTVTHYKIGYRLGYADGLAFGRELAAAGKTVFFDLKLHDIDNTVREGVESVARMGAHYLTVHAYPQTMKAAVAGRAGTGLKILAVTILTSWNDLDCAEAGYSGTVSTLVPMKARQAAAIGIDGIVCSAQETAQLRAVGIPPAIEFVTPGIRPSGSASGDQKRIVTPADAIRGGADRLVVGRPITAAADPVEAARGILIEIDGAAA